MTELREFNMAFFRSADKRWVTANDSNAAVQDYVHEKAIMLVKCTNIEDDEASAEIRETLEFLKDTGVLDTMPQVQLDRLTEA